jgi:hypothetical protein
VSCVRASSVSGRTAFRKEEAFERHLSLSLSSLSLSIYVWNAAGANYVFWSKQPLAIAGALDAAAVGVLDFQAKDKHARAHATVARVDTLR